MYNLANLYNSCTIKNLSSRSLISLILRYVLPYIHIYTYTYIYTYVRMYIRTYTCMYIHTYAHTYIHTYMLLDSLLIYNYHHKTEYNTEFAHAFIREVSMLVTIWNDHVRHRSEEKRENQMTRYIDLRTSTIVFSVHDHAEKRTVTVLPGE